MKKQFTLLKYSFRMLKVSICHLDGNDADALSFILKDSSPIPNLQSLRKGANA